MALSLFTKTKKAIIERAQDIGDPLWILHAEPAPVPGREKPFEGLVPERVNHTQSVRYELTLVNQCLTIVHGIWRD